MTDDARSTMDRLAGPEDGNAPGEGQCAQKPTAATYITDEEVKTVNSQPGVDRTIRVVDIGNEHFAVGVIHRVATGAARRIAATWQRGSGQMSAIDCNPPEISVPARSAGV